MSIGLLEGKECDIGEELADVFSKFDAEQGGVDEKSFEGNINLVAERQSFGSSLMSWVYTTWIILHRTFIIKLRDPICLATQLSSAIIMGLIFGALYLNVYDKSTTSFAILDAQMCIVMSVLMAVWLPYDVTLTFPIERRIFLRERKAGLTLPLPSTWRESLQTYLRMSSVP